MALSIEKLVQMIDEGWTSTPPVRPNQFYLISPDRYTTADIGKLRAFLVFLRARYQAKFEIVGGGASCSKLIMEIVGDDGTKVAEVVRDVLSDPAVAERYQEINLRALIWPARELDFDPVTGKPRGKAFNLSPMSITNNTTIIGRDVTGGVVSTGDKNVIVSPQQHVQELFDKMQAALAKDPALTPQQKEEHGSDLETLRKEIGREKPRRAIVEPLLGTLANVATIATFIKEMAPFLPKVFG